MKQLFTRQNIKEVFKECLTQSRSLSIWGAVFAIIIFILTYSLSYHYFYNQIQEKFEKEVHKEVDSFKDRLNDYELILISSAGLLTSADNVTAKKWFSFIENIHLKNRFPAVKSIGYAQMATKKEIPQLEKRMRKEGSLAYKVVSDHNRSLYCPILFTEPFHIGLVYQNGYDLFNDPDNVKSLMQAQIQNTAIISKETIIGKSLDSPAQRGMLIYLPVFSTNVTGHKHLKGFVYLSFLTQDFIEANNKNKDLLLTLSDITNTSKEPMYKTQTSAAYKEPKHAFSKKLHLYGRVWELSYTSSSQFDEKNDNPYPLVFVFFGMLLYFALLYIIMELWRSRKTLLKRSGELESSRSWLNLLLSSSIDGVHILNMQGKLVEYSPSFLKMLGYEPHEADKLSVYDIEAKLTKEQIQKTMEHVSATPKSFQTLLRKKDNTVFDAEISLKSIEIDGKKYIYASARNISDMCQTRMELQNSKEFYKTMFASLNDTILILENNIIKDCNIAALKLFKSTKKSLIGAHILDIIYDVECKERSFYHYLDAAHLGDYKTAECSFHLKHDPNEVRIMEFSLSKFGHKDENKLIMVARDITKQIEDDKLMKLHTRQAQMGEMISMIAHQWRQPLAVINAIVSQLRLKAALNEDKDETYVQSLVKIEAQTVHLSQTISDYRNFFNPNKLKECFYISSLIKNVHSLIDHIAENKSISFEDDIVEDCAIYTYRNEVLQVLLALVKNSLDMFIEKPADEPKLVISTYRDAGHVYISVYDNAGGIPKKVMKKLFTPYFTTKEKNNGTGLGLYMSKLIIYEHCEGEINVASQGDETTFTVKLPYQEEIQDAVADKH